MGEVPLCSKWVVIECAPVTWRFWSRGRKCLLPRDQTPEGRRSRGTFMKKRGFVIQGNLAHKKTPTPLGPPKDPRHRPTVGSRGEAFSYE